MKPQFYHQDILIENIKFQGKLFIYVREQTNSANLALLQCGKEKKRKKDICFIQVKYMCIFSKFNLLMIIKELAITSS